MDDDLLLMLEQDQQRTPLPLPLEDHSRPCKPKQKGSIASFVHDHAIEQKQQHR